MLEETDHGRAEAVRRLLESADQRHLERGQEPTHARIQIALLGVQHVGEHRPVGLGKEPFESRTQRGVDLGRRRVGDTLFRGVVLVVGGATRDVVEPAAQGRRVEVLRKADRASERQHGERLAVRVHQIGFAPGLDVVQQPHRDVRNHLGGRLLDLPRSKRALHRLAPARLRRTVDGQHRGTTARSVQGRARQRGGEAHRVLGGVDQILPPCDEPQTRPRASRRRAPHGAAVRRPDTDRARVPRRWSSRSRRRRGPRARRRRARARA